MFVSVHRHTYIHTNLCIYVRGVVLRAPITFTLAIKYPRLTCTDTHTYVC